MSALGADRGLLLREMTKNLGRFLEDAQALLLEHGATGTAEGSLTGGRGPLTQEEAMRLTATIQAAVRTLETLRRAVEAQDATGATEVWRKWQEWANREWGDGQ
jgi:hypothetical protein